MSDEGWVKVSLEVEAAQIEEACALLWEEGASGVEVQDDETFIELQPLVAPGQARAVAWFGAEPAERVQARLQEALGGYGLQGAALEAAPFTDESWKTNWKQFFKPHRVSERLAVRPPWEEADFGDQVQLLVIEPGMAFGTGTHPTTRLCMKALDELLAASHSEPASMLDVGCGSGILSISAVKLTQGLRALALDVDPEAHRVTQENSEVNGTQDRVQVLSGLLEEVQEPAALVVANILAHILLRLRDDLVRCTEPGGQLLLSGIGAGQEEEVKASFQAAGMELVRQQELEGWVALHMRKA